MLQQLSRVMAYVRRNHWELPANALEAITLVLLVFVQDVAFKECLIVCALLLFISLTLHGLAYRAGQCKIWPKVIELAAPVPFVAMIPAAYLAYTPTQKSAFITINLWFAVVEVICWMAGRNFMLEYLQDWNSKEVWGTPLLERSARATAISWIICQLIMAVAQGLAVAFNLSIESGNVGAAIFVCYIMQLLPLLFAIVFTFAYPAWLRKCWGCVKGVRATYYPPPEHGIRTAPDAGVPTAAGISAAGGQCSSSSSSSSIQQSLASSSSSMAAEDVFVCISPQADSKKGSQNSSSDGGCSIGVPCIQEHTPLEVDQQQQQQQLLPNQFDHQQQQQQQRPQQHQHQP